MKKNLIIKGSLKGSRPLSRGDDARSEATLEELLAKIKFKRTVRRILKLIRS